MSISFHRLLIGILCEHSFFFNIDELVKSRTDSIFVIPAKAGIQSFRLVMDSGFRRSDELCDFLRDHQSSLIKKNEV